MSEDRQKFVDYIVGLAAGTVGETALLVRQKPTHDSEGNFIFHADGAPKATFPAFLPEKARIKEGEAWYVNTGSFVHDAGRHRHKVQDTAA